MEKKLHLRSSGSGPITAISYLPPKREVIVGHEDGKMKCWALDSGTPTTSCHKHTGYVSALLYWTEGKVLFSASLDSTVVQWSSSFVPYYTIELPGPIYTLLWNPHKDKLICGRKGCIGILSLSGKSANIGLPYLSKKEQRMNEHTDVVKCVISQGSRAYSGGYDRKLIIYEMSSHSNALPLQVLSVNSHAHTAGITCMVITNDTDRNTWLITGSFDHTVKIWTREGTYLQTISFQHPVTGLCYVFPTKLLWIAAGTHMPQFFEPKLGVNVTKSISVFGDTPVNMTRNILYYQYFPEISEVIGFTNLKELMSWHYTSSCTTSIHYSPSAAHMETLCYTRKFPILIFTGSYDGVMTKWERHQLNNFVYNFENIEFREKLNEFLLTEDAEWNLLDILDREVEEVKERSSEARFRRDMKQRSMPTGAEKEQCQIEMMKDNYRGFVHSIYMEDLDYLMAASLDGKIFVWGYDTNNIDILMHQLHLQEMDKHSFTASRVVGLSCLHVLNGHSSSVSGLAVVKNEEFYLVSCGWDGKVCVWNMSNNASMVSCTDFSRGRTGVLSPGAIITNVAYSKEYHLVAFSTSDCTVHLCTFCDQEYGLKVKSTLRGHNNEVTQVEWNKVLDKWVTGSEDGTIRLWLPNASSTRCEVIVSTRGPVSVIVIDKNYGFILAAIIDTIKLYDGELELLQVFRGHTESIQAILHIPELDQYVSSGWDNRLHIWKAYHPSRRHTLLKSSRHLKEVKLEADKERREKKENKEVL